MSKQTDTIWSKCRRNRERIRHTRNHISDFGNSIGKDLISTISYDSAIKTQFREFTLSVNRVPSKPNKKKLSQSNFRQTTDRQV